MGQKRLSPEAGPLGLPRCALPFRGKFAWGDPHRANAEASPKREPNTRRVTKVTDRTTQNVSADPLSGWGVVSIVQGGWLDESSVTMEAQEHFESSQLTQQYETSLLSDQAVNEGAANLSGGAAAAAQDNGDAAAVHPDAAPQRAAFVASPMQLEFPLEMLPQSTPTSGPRRSRRSSRRCCAVACCRGLSGAAMGLSAGLVVTFVVSSLELEFDFSHIAVGFLGCWVLSTLLGAIAGVVCFLRCGNRPLPHQRRARPLPLPNQLHACTSWLRLRGFIGNSGTCCDDVTPYLSVPVLGPLVGALLVLLLLAIPSPPQHQIMGLLEVLLPSLYSSPLPSPLPSLRTAHHFAPPITYSPRANTAICGCGRCHRTLTLPLPLPLTRSCSG